MARKQKSFKGVTLEYPITLIDTSALLSPIDDGLERGDESYEARILRSQLGFDSAIFYRRFLENEGRFYITQNVWEEYTSSDYVSRKQKELEEKGYLPRKEFELFKERKREDKERKRLIYLLESGGMVYTLSDEEQEEYNFLNSKYSRLKNRGVVGDVDFNLLISVAAVSKKGKRPACLISSDGGILDYWREIGVEERMSPEKFGFFVRIEADVFQRENYTLNKKRRRRFF